MEKRSVQRRVSIVPPGSTLLQSVQRRVLTVTEVKVGRLLVHVTAP